MSESLSLLHAAPSDRGRLARRALVDAATIMLQRTPADELNIAEITRRAGVSRPTFYRHFENPPALVREATLAKLQASFAATPPPDTAANWIPSARATIHRLLAELHRDARFYLNAIQGPLGLQLMGDAIDFLSQRILKDSPLAPLLRANEGPVAASYHAAFLSAGVAWHILQWLHTDFTGSNSVDETADRILTHLVAVTGAAAVSIPDSE